MYQINLFTTEFTVQFTVCILYGIITNPQAIQGLLVVITVQTQHSWSS